MGLLTEGGPLTWEETKNMAQYVRDHGIIQFINLYNRTKDRKGDIFKWGDEIEYMLIKFDEGKKQAKVSLKSKEMLDKLQKIKEEHSGNLGCVWNPEYGAFMIEGTPGKPYANFLGDFVKVEPNMKFRRKVASQLLENDEVLVTLTSFPRLGCKNFTYPPSKPMPGTSSTESIFFPDEVLYPGHPRFFTFSRNIMERRREKLTANLPVFKDINTRIPVDDCHLLCESVKPDQVHLDSAGFGGCCCCLQATMQAYDLDEARILYDQLAVLCPIMLAFSAASPIQRGHLTDVDCRWLLMSSVFDCRTEEERGLKPLSENKFVIDRPRYNSIHSYLSPQGAGLNDVPLVYDKKVYEKLRANDVDHLLAEHVAHLFIRDTICLFAEQLNQDDKEDTEHYENILSTNWQTMRLKAPPKNSDIGWRVEFRPCEVQITDFENAAIVCFIALMSRVILAYKLDLLVPISKIDQNILACQKRNACQTEQFWFRTDVVTDQSPPECKDFFEKFQKSNENGVGKSYDLLSFNEIFNGKTNVFPGLVPLAENYISNLDLDVNTLSTIQKQLVFIGQRSSGEILTTASWIRQFVMQHPAYERNSKISEKINYDLLKTVAGIQSGTISCPDLLGDSTVTRSKEYLPTTITRSNSVQ